MYMYVLFSFFPVVEGVKINLKAQGRVGGGGGGGVERKVEERRVSVEEKKRVVLKPKQRMSEGGRRPVCLYSSFSLSISFPSLIYSIILAISSLSSFSFIFFFSFLSSLPLSLQVWLLRRESWRRRPGPSVRRSISKRKLKLR